VPRRDPRYVGASHGRATGEDDRYLKLVFDGVQERLLGAQTTSYTGAELIQMVALAIVAAVSRRRHEESEEPGEICEVRADLARSAEPVHRAPPPRK
jgi:Pyridine nucleotide-disulphide oxidoreductase, dimerisation domain